MVTTWMTLRDTPRGGMGVRAVSHIHLGVHHVVKAPALRPLSGVPLHTHQNLLASPVHSHMPMDKLRMPMVRYTTRASSSSRAAVVSTVLVQPAVAQAFIAQDPSTPISIVAAALLTAVQNALPRKVAIASHRISVLPLASDRPPPRPARMTGPVPRHSRQLQERSLVHDPHSTRYASPRLQVRRGPSMLCNDPLRR
jgi:hypothetical protein